VYKIKVVSHRFIYLYVRLSLWVSDLLYCSRR